MLINDTNFILGLQNLHVLGNLSYRNHGGGTSFKSKYLGVTVLTFHSMLSNTFYFSLRCDADPSALANYVVALVKKDKPEKELKAFCADQLDVFLQKGIVTRHANRPWCGMAYVEMVGSLYKQVSL